MDISELFAEFIRSINMLDLQDMDEVIEGNGWGIKKITDVDNANVDKCLFLSTFSYT